MAEKEQSSPIRLNDRLTTLGKQALDRLCDKYGCDRKTLLGLFALLYNNEPIEITLKAADQEATVIIHSLDSFNRKEMFGDFTPRKFHQIAELAKKLQDIISQLQKTEFVKDLNAQGILPETDLLRISPLL